MRYQDRTSDEVRITFSTRGDGDAYNLLEKARAVWNVGRPTAKDIDSRDGRRSATTRTKKKKKKKKKNLFVKFTTITITTEKKDTLTGYQGGHTPINAGPPMTNHM